MDRASILKESGAQKWAQFENLADFLAAQSCSKLLIFIGSSGRTRTYNPSVNSRLEASECLYFQ